MTPAFALTLGVMVATATVIAVRQYRAFVRIEREYEASARAEEYRAEVELFWRARRHESLSRRRQEFTCAACGATGLTAYEVLRSFSAEPAELRVARSRCLPCHVEAVARDAERALRGEAL